MSDIQTKLGDGLSMLKGGIQQGKQKLQQVQEISELRKKVKDANLKKTKILLDMGQQAFQLVREGSLQDEKIKKLSEAIVQLDKTIYQANLKIQEISEISVDSKTCECGTQIHASDKFCGSCGKKVTVPEVVVNAEQTTCPACQEQISVTSKFCNCCGTRMV
ncbi:zinc ribbon domain-containing protein [Paenibacillus alginolyticus]|uniref:Zinc ribbon domain-containing protein n=1 Tax=Paenibacillus alginolyticus TaxID=59839 RepID=A0ABT4G7A6_9BACL|nr:zinc ribbon domain-containing protein [Paenibacillus alginolyticus]MCY9692061.1 zinc ribbon domain-containing protein [Paenibacillus alginolyticus]MEC0144251.1 zinc ribbon domain-containing protein [Paenibacillus alginolyticus]